MLSTAGAAGLLATVPVLRSTQRAAASTAATDGTPEQIHLTFGADPATSMSVSWASPVQAPGARVLLSGPHLPGVEVPAVQRTYTDGLNGETVWTYHVQLEQLAPDTQYSYVVTADNDNSAAPFAGTFRTAPRGPSKFRFTSFGDLATPNTAWVLSYGESAYAVAAVESFNPLFHLLNGDLCYANLNPAVQPEVWRDCGNNNQSSAAFRAWMPVAGNHEIEFNNGAQGYSSYLTRYQLPDNGVPGFRGNWYSFHVCNVLFVALQGDEVVYRDAGAFVSGPAPLVPATSTGNPAIPPGTSLYISGYLAGAQTAWLEQTLAAARQNPSIDWIVAQIHQIACSFSKTGNGSDRGIRQQWLPLFDKYEVDLVLNGHDLDYERSFPVRGFDPMAGTDAATGEPVETLRPHPVTTTDTGVFDTSKGTVHLVLGGGGTSANLDDYGLDNSDGLTEAKVFTKPNRPVPAAKPGVYTRAGADAREDAIWSARRDTSTGYGIGVFDVDPGSENDEYTTITVRYFHALGADPTNPTTGAKGTPNSVYTHFETVKLIRPRSRR